MLTMCITLCAYSFPKIFNLDNLKFTFIIKYKIKMNLKYSQFEFDVGEFMLFLPCLVYLIFHHSKLKDYDNIM